MAKTSMTKTAQRSPAKRDLVDTGTESHYAKRTGDGAEKDMAEPEA